MIGRDLTRAAAFAFAVTVMMPLGSAAQVIQIDPLSGAVRGPSDTGEADADRQPFMSPEEHGRNAGSASATKTPAEPDTENRLVPLRISTPRIDALQTPRLSGEVAVEKFVLFLPAPPGATELRLVNRSGVDLLPEASTLQVTVNGTLLGEIVPDNFTGFAEDRLIVPEGVLQQGRNLVVVKARQTHRIACGPDASFALWTEIDAGKSGVSVPDSAFNTDALGFMSAISAQAALGQAIELRRPDPEASLMDAAPFIGNVTSALGGTSPAIKSTSYWPLVGTSPSLARITAFPAGQGPTAPRFERGGDGAIVLVLERGSDYASISESLVAAANGLDEATIRTLTTGSPQPLSALQPRSLTGEGHYILLEVPFQLPWDWLLMSSQNGRLDLDYRFASGLAEGSLMIVKVNDMPVRLLPLDAGGGATLPTLPISFGARFLRPGANQLSFEVLVPGDPVDRACPSSGASVVEISETSLLFVPSSPSMSLPTIDRSLASLSLDRIVLTNSASELLPPGFVPGVAAALAVPNGESAPFSDVGQLNIGTLADLETLRPDWRGADSSALVRAMTEERLRSLDSTPENPATAWDIVLDAGDDNSQPSDGLANLPLRMVAALRRLVLGDREPLETWIADRTAQAAILQPDANRPGELWLIIGPQAMPEEIARSLVVSRNGMGGPTGQVAIFTNARVWESWAAPGRPLRLHESLNFRNVRDALGNYATHKPLSFIAVIFGLTALSAASATALLLVTREGRG
jgi:hypothetical protein